MDDVCTNFFISLYDDDKGGTIFLNKTEKDISAEPTTTGEKPFVTYSMLACAFIALKSKQTIYGVNYETMYDEDTRSTVTYYQCYTCCNPTYNWPTSTSWKSYTRECAQSMDYVRKWADIYKSGIQDNLHE